MSILVVDVGTSGLRVSVALEDATIVEDHYEEVLAHTPAPGLVELDGTKIARRATALATQIAESTSHAIKAVAITNQRASTLVWERQTGELIAPGLGWQDLRTVGECQQLASEGFGLAPNLSATKLAHLLDMYDPERSRDLCFGTVDCWLAWSLSGGRHHVTDRTNAAMTGLLTAEGSGWDHRLLQRLNIPESCLPEIVATSGVAGYASEIAGGPPICALVGDQQASMVGQGIVAPGEAKITFGTGAMLDLVSGTEAPHSSKRGPGGSYPIVAFEREGQVFWGREAVMLSAGTNLEWLRDDMGLISDVADSAELAAACEDTGGAVFVPALLGLGTPYWDFGARGTLTGMTRGTGRAEIVRAVLEGIADRGADLVEAAETDTATELASVRVDGGMSCNPFFVQALANATQRPIEVSPVREATTLGAAFLAGLEVGMWNSWEDLAATWSPTEHVGPNGPDRREEHRRAVQRTLRWIPELSDLAF